MCVAGIDRLWISRWKEYLIPLQKTALNVLILSHMTYHFQHRVSAVQIIFMLNCLGNNDKNSLHMCNTDARIPLKYCNLKLVESTDMELMDTDCQLYQLLVIKSEVGVEIRILKIYTHHSKHGGFPSARTSLIKMMVIWTVEICRGCCRYCYCFLLLKHSILLIDNSYMPFNEFFSYFPLLLSVTSPSSTLHARTPPTLHPCLKLSIVKSSLLS